MLLGMSVLGWLGGRKFRRQVRELKHGLDEITGVVDSFYSAVGERGWIFHDDLDLDAMREVARSPDEESAERRLIAYYKSGDRIQWSLRRIGHHDAMRPRVALAQRALHDYQQGRYYSCVLVILAVMDGFVNDFEPSRRKGLHARDSAEMSAWDRAAGHHKGLASVHRTYNQRVSKVDTTEQFALRRNGLMHGMLPNFDNPVIATKAWNLLFAVSDWADGEVARLTPKEDEPSLLQTLRRYADIQAAKKKSEGFEPYVMAASDDQLNDLRESVAVHGFLEAWQRRQWGPVGGFFVRFGSQPHDVGRQAIEARALYAGHPLKRWTITRVRRETSSLAFVEAEAEVGGITRQLVIRLILCDETNDVELDPNAGRWFVAPYYPESFWAPREGASE